MQPPADADPAVRPALRRATLLRSPLHESSDGEVLKFLTACPARLFPQPSTLDSNGEKTADNDDKLSKCTLWGNSDRQRNT